MHYFTKLESCVQLFHIIIVFGHLGKQNKNKTGLARKLITHISLHSNISLHFICRKRFDFFDLQSNRSKKTANVGRNEMGGRKFKSFSSNWNGMGPADAVAGVGAEFAAELPS